ncbi:MAG: DMT family transporter [Rhodobacteraceae bacterium]|jgi:drug/metabolite transporter (DMT)-like permease|nr:DMT family transporter [Paracoccaceae bacterium]
MPEAVPPPPASASRQDNLRAAGWLILDMSLNIWALTIVKAMGADYPALQLVFLRSATGLVLLVPWIWRERGAFARIDRPGLHALRVILSTVTLATSFHAVARLPFALFTAINFTRPILLMLMAALILRERITGPRWIAAVVGLGGALIAIDPVTAPLNSGLVALLVTVVTGTAAVIVTRQLKGTPAVVMMTFYTAGLGLASLPVALAAWHPVSVADLPLLLGVGLFAQAAQLCFLRAHWLGDAGVLGPVSYTSLILSGLVGYAVFAEVPTPGMLVGAAIIVIAALSLAR